MNLTVVDCRDTHRGVKNVAQPELELETPSCLESIQTPKETFIERERKYIPILQVLISAWCLFYFYSHKSNKYSSALIRMATTLKTTPE